MSIWFKSAGLVRKSISWGIIFCFLTNTLAYGNSLPLATPQGVPLSVSIQTPSEYGAIEEQKFYLSKPLLIHIQDAHANPMGERNIAKIITHLVEIRGIKTIFVEGAAENPQAKYLTFINNPKLNQKLIDRLVDLGEVTGAELALIDPKIKRQIKLIGIEETQNYRKDFDLFREVVKDQEKSEKFLEESRKALDQKASRVLSKDLLMLLRAFLDLDEKDTRWLAFVSDLYRMSRKVLGRDLRDAKEQIEFPNLVRLYRLKEEEGKIDLEQVKKEVQHEPRLKEFLEKGSEKNPRLLLERINHEMKSQGFDFGRYPYFVRYTRNRIFQYELESSALFEELTHLAELLFSKLANREEEKKVIQEGKEFKLLRNLLLLKLTRKEYEELKEVPPVASQALNFYKKAIEREKLFEQKIESNLKESKERQAIVVTGGFHTEGLRRFFDNEQIPHTVIRPKVDGGHLDIYQKSMMLGSGRSIEYSEIPKALIAQSPIAQAASLGAEAYEAREKLVDREIQNVSGTSLGSGDGAPSMEETKQTIDEVLAILKNPNFKDPEERDSEIRNAYEKIEITKRFYFGTDLLENSENMKTLLNNPLAILLIHALGEIFRTPHLLRYMYMDPSWNLTKIIYADPNGLGRLALEELVRVFDTPGLSWEPYNDAFNMLGFVIDSEKQRDRKYPDLPLEIKSRAFQGIAQGIVRLPFDERSFAYLAGMEALANSIAFIPKEELRKATALWDKLDEILANEKDFDRQYFPSVFKAIEELAKKDVDVICPKTLSLMKESLSRVSKYKKLRSEQSEGLQVSGLKVFKEIFVRCDKQLITKELFSFLHGFISEGRGVRSAALEVMTQIVKANIEPENPNSLSRQALQVLENGMEALALAEIVKANLAPKNGNSLSQQAFNILEEWVREGKCNENIARALQQIASLGKKSPYFQKILDAIEAGLKERHFDYDSQGNLIKALVAITQDGRGVFTRLLETPGLDPKVYSLLCKSIPEILPAIDGQTVKALEVLLENPSFDSEVYAAIAGAIREIAKNWHTFEFISEDTVEALGHLLKNPGFNSKPLHVDTYRAIVEALVPIPIHSDSDHSKLKLVSKTLEDVLRTPGLPPGAYSPVATYLCPLLEFTFSPETSEAFDAALTRPGLFKEDYAHIAQSFTIAAKSEKERFATHVNGGKYPMLRRLIIYDNFENKDSSSSPRLFELFGESWAAFYTNEAEKEKILTAFDRWILRKEKDAEGRLTGREVLNHDRELRQLLSFQTFWILGLLGSSSNAGKAGLQAFFKDLFLSRSINSLVLLENLKSLPFFESRYRPLHQILCDETLPLHSKIELLSTVLPLVTTEKFLEDSVDITNPSSWSSWQVWIFYKTTPRTLLSFLLNRKWLPQFLRLKFEAAENFMVRWVKRRERPLLAYLEAKYQEGVQSLRVESDQKTKQKKLILEGFKEKTHEILMATLADIAYGDYRKTDLIPEELLKNPEFIEKLMSVTRVVTNLKQLEDDEVLRGRVKEIFQIMLSRDPKRPYDLKERLAQVRSHILNLPGNKEELEHLVSPEIGYSRRFFEKGHSVSVKQGGPADEKIRFEFYKNAYQEFLDMAEAFKMKDIKEAFQSKTSVEELKVYAEELKKVILAHPDGKKFEARIREIDENVKQYEKSLKKSESAGLEEYTIVIEKSFFDEGVSPENIPGCYAPTGIHREMPLKHAMETNSFMARVYDSRGQQVSNAVVFATDQGLYPYAEYNAGGRDLSSVWAKLWSELVRRGDVPRVILADKSAGYSASKRWASEAQNISLLRRSTVWKSIYVDSGDVDVDGNVSLNFDHHLQITPESLKAAGYKRESVTFADQEISVRDALRDLLGEVLKEKGLGRYGFILGTLRSIQKPIDEVTVSDLREKIDPVRLKISEEQFKRDLESILAVIRELKEKLLALKSGIREESFPFAASGLTNLADRYRARLDESVQAGLMPIRLDGPKSRFYTPIRGGHSIIRIEGKQIKIQQVVLEKIQKFRRSIEKDPASQMKNKIIRDYLAWGISASRQAIDAKQFEEQVAWYAKKLSKKHEGNAETAAKELKVLNELGLVTQYFSESVIECMEGERISQSPLKTEDLSSYLSDLQSGKFKDEAEAYAELLSFLKRSGLSRGSGHRAYDATEEPNEETEIDRWFRSEIQPTLSQTRRISTWGLPEYEDLGPFAQIIAKGIVETGPTSFVAYEKDSKIYVDVHFPESLTTDVIDHEVKNSRILAENFADTLERNVILKVYSPVKTDSFSHWSEETPFESLASQIWREKILPSYRKVTAATAFSAKPLVLEIPYQRERQAKAASLGREEEKKSEARSLGDIIDTGKITENIFDSEAWKQWPTELRQLIILPQAEASINPNYRMQQVMNYLLTHGVSVSDVMLNPVTVMVTQEFLEKTAENGEPLLDSLSKGDEVLVVMEDGAAHSSKEFLREKFPGLFDLARKRKIHFDAIRANHLDRALQQKMMGFSLMNKGGEQGLVLSNPDFANIAFDEPALKLKPEDRKLVFTLLKRFALMSGKEREHAYRTMGFEEEGKLWVVGKSLGQILEKLEQDVTRGRLTSIAA